MPYTMVWYVDGGCRRNGSSSDAMGAAAAVRKMRGNMCWIYTRELEDWDISATNQRAELLAMIIALEESLRIYRELSEVPTLDLTIYSDSGYAVACMTKWVQRWSRNGYMNAKGLPVANQDLIREAVDLESELRDYGSVKWKWIPREKNQMADNACRMVLDESNKPRDYYTSRAYLGY